MLSTNSREAVVDPGISRGDRAEVRILVEGAAHIVGRFPPGSSAQTAAYVFASDGRKFGEFEYATP
ncbi:MAG: hypothetical protein R3F34_21055, partial [Planctomycetota bacterium]